MEAVISHGLQPVRLIYCWNKPISGQRVLQAESLQENGKPSKPKIRPKRGAAAVADNTSQQAFPSNTLAADFSEPFPLSLARTTKLFKYLSSSLRSSQYNKQDDRKITPFKEGKSLHFWAVYPPIIDPSEWGVFRAMITCKWCKWGSQTREIDARWTFPIWVLPSYFRARGKTPRKITNEARHFRAQSSREKNNRNNNEVGVVFQMSFFLSLFRCNSEFCGGCDVTGDWQ